MSGEPCWELLPDDLVYEIFCRLDPESLLAVAKVCSSWKAIANENFVWDKATEGAISRLYVSTKQPGEVKSKYIGRRNFRGVQDRIHNAPGHNKAICNYCRTRMSRDSPAEFKEEMKRRIDALQSDLGRMSSRSPSVALSVNMEGVEIDGSNSRMIDGGAWVMDRGHSDTTENSEPQNPINRLSMLMRQVKDLGHDMTLLQKSNIAQRKFGGTRGPE